MCKLFQFAVSGIMLAASAAGCASGFFPKPKAEDVAVAQEQRHEEVVAAFEEKRDQAQFQAAMIRWREGDAAACRELTEKLLARNPRHRGGRLLRAELNLIDEKPELALADIEKLVAEHPRDAEVCHMLALLFEATGKRAEALAHFERAAELAPESEVIVASYQAARDGEVLVGDASSDPATISRNETSAH
jgi:tetratricopeptide (TPR) repeat protein